MFHLKKLLSILLCIALLLSLAACDGSTVPTDPTGPQPTDPPAMDPATKALLDRYDARRETLLASDTLQLEIETTQHITIGTQTLSTTTTQSVTLSGRNGASLAARLEEKITKGEYKDKFLDYYSNGMLYTKTPTGEYYKGDMGREEFLDRIVPPVLLDETLYETISSSDGTLSFADPTAAEDWALPEGAQLHSASGVACLPTEGESLETSYEVRYLYSGMDVTQTVKVSASTVPDYTDLSPDPSIEYALLDSVEGARVMDLAMHTLLSAEHVSTSIYEVMVCYATGTALERTFDVSYYGGSGEDHMSIRDCTGTIVQGQKTTTDNLLERFENGQYTSSLNGGKETLSPDITVQTMYEYCQEHLTKATIQPEKIQNIKVTNLGDLTYVEYTCPGHGHDLCNYVCQTLFGNAEYLDSFGFSCPVQKANVFLTVDSFTGIPTGISVEMEINHRIIGSSYPLTMEYNQSFDIDSATVYESITDEPEPATGPVEGPTPLLYHVTGKNGQEMWLFGTIHVGDSRTGALPQELLDAFAASDALAVEFDSEAFEEDMAINPNLAQQILQLYTYSDGSPTSDHLSAEVYEQALRLLRATGNYNTQMTYFRPSIWMSEIENFYLRMGYALSPAWGLESQLYKLAKEQNKSILEVESAYSQARMLTGFSSKLQELLLSGTVFTPMRQYCADTNALYELWCTGDEVALRQAINQPTGDMTAAEQLLYEEYDKAMNTDRNNKMLKVVKSYLESGDTVFCAVGLAHLLDDGYGLVDALRTAGYTVELVSYS